MRFREECFDGYSVSNIKVRTHRNQRYTAHLYTNEDKHYVACDSTLDVFLSSPEDSVEQGDGHNYNAGCEVDHYEMKNENDRGFPKQL